MVVATAPAEDHRPCRLAASICAGVTLLAGFVVTTPAGASAPAVARVAVVAELGQPAANPLNRFAYLFVHDSGGGSPSAGAQFALLFAAGGEAYVYASNATQGFADAGSFSYSGGQLSLHFATADLKVDATFALSLPESRVTMPFQVLSSKKGTSLWQQEPLALDQGILAVYNAAVNATALNLTTAEAGQRAYEFAQAWLAAGPRGGSRAGDRLPAQLRPAGSPPGPVPSLCTGQGTYCITSVVDLGDDIEVNYTDQPSVLIELYSSGLSEPSAPLSLNPLSSDPRVFLDPAVHPDSQFDPPVKQAVLVIAQPKLESPSALLDMEKWLTARHYRVRELLGTQASVLGIVTALKAGPGFVLLSTHGDNDGNLLTGEVVSVGGLSARSDATAAQELGAELRSEGLGSLAGYKLGGLDPFSFIAPNCSLKVFPWPPDQSCNWHVVVTPAFWHWLETDYGASFGNSLVFISACDTDATPLLRDEIKAKAYFAFTGDVDTKFATAVEEYLVESLARPTHSPEEAFYNMLRIEHSREMIYREDRLFNGVLGAQGSNASFDILDGWGWNGSTLVAYRGNGWTSDKVNGGQVWWMLYAARWVKNTTDAAAKLNYCLSTYWLKGNPGGLADQYCNAANAGIPKDPASLVPDVAYAIYLLTGKPPAGFPPDQLPPRWTMDD